ncbi:MAG: VOC family protein [Acidobacteriota bacterium]|nr:VOC family protein [Acidobacteriota bacterium]
MMSKIVQTVIVLTLCWFPPDALGQLAPPNQAGVAMGHLHYHVSDVEANTRFWVALGGTANRVGQTMVVTFPDVLVLLTEEASSGGTEGSILNHVAFRVRSLDTVAASGFDFGLSDSFSGVTSVFTPEGERIELFDDSATNLTFTIDDGGIDPVAERHNEPLSVPVIAHHLHLYLPEGAVAEAKRWYASHFGGTPGMRWRYDAVDLPGINFNFSSRPEVGVPTRGRMLDHIGLEVTNLKAFCQALEDQGVSLDQPYRTGELGVDTAVLTDPWGTTIVLTEGLRDF